MLTVMIKMMVNRKMSKMMKIEIISIYSDDHCQKEHIAHVAVGHANATILTTKMTMTTVPY